MVGVILEVNRFLLHMENSIYQAAFALVSLPSIFQLHVSSLIFPFLVSKKAGTQFISKTLVLRAPDSRPYSINHLSLSLSFLFLPSPVCSVSITFYPCPCMHPDHTHTQTHTLASAAEKDEVWAGGEQARCKSSVESRRPRRDPRETSTQLSLAEMSTKGALRQAGGQLREGGC